MVLTIIIEKEIARDVGETCSLLRRYEESRLTSRWSERKGQLLHEQNPDFGLSRRFVFDVDSPLGFLHYVDVCYLHLHGQSGIVSFSIGLDFCSNKFTGEEWEVGARLGPIGYIGKVIKRPFLGPPNAPKAIGNWCS
jgi:hypothetical protein